MIATRHDSPRAFLDAAESFLMEREAVHNLMLSLTYAREASGEWTDDTLFATVRAEADGAVVGAAIRTPPHKLLVTWMPPEATEPMARLAADVYDQIPAVLGPEEVAELVASHWAVERGGTYRLGMRQRIYRLDSVRWPPEVPGRFRAGTPADVDIAIEWGEGFTRDTGVAFPTPAESVNRWLANESLFFWEDGEPVSVAVGQGDTRNGGRVSYVYTPPEHRGKGYASACVAHLSQTMLERGWKFCILYTDLSNPTSNQLYQRLGYEPVQDVRDVEIVPEE